MATSLQRQLDKANERNARLADEIKALKKERTALQRDFRQAVSDERVAKKAVVQSQSTITRLEKQLETHGITPITKPQKKK